MKPKFIGKAKITKQGQVTVPSEARSAIGVDTNDDVYWYEVNGSLVASKDLMCEEDLALSLNKEKNQDRSYKKNFKGKRRK